MNNQNQFLLTSLTIQEFEALIHQTIQSSLSNSPTKTSNQDKPMTREEACQYLKIKAPTLHKYMNSQKIKYHKLGRLTRFFRKDLDDFLKSNNKHDWKKK